MKLKNKYIALAAVGVVALTSCSDTLNVEAPSQNDASMVYMYCSVKTRTPLV